MQVYNFGTGAAELASARQLHQILESADDSELHLIASVSEEDMFGPTHNYLKRLSQNEMPAQKRLKLKLKDLLKQSLGRCDLELQSVDTP